MGLKNKGVVLASPLPPSAVLQFCRWGDVFCHTQELASVAQRIGTLRLCIKKILHKN